MLKFLCISLILTLPALSQERLTDEEKRNLLAKVLERESVALEGQVQSQATAIRDFTAALGSEKDVFELYLKCREKLAEEEGEKSSREIRESERRVKDRASDEFKRALVHQLYFLRHSLGIKEDDKEQRQAAIQKILSGQTRAIQDVVSLSGEMVFKGSSPLKQDPFGSAFARAYGIEDLKPKEWPGHVLDFDGLYASIIIPELIKKGKYGEAREQWANRIKGEALLHEEHGEPAADKSEKPASYVKFIEEQVPNLRWSLEETLYGQGDEKTAATNLFNILSTYPEHPNYLNWAKKLKEVLEVGQDSAPAVTETVTEGTVAE